jgi:NAD(P)-dependent dehydrogenase (short-subunit alcohol dehydrogenase family)
MVFARSGAAARRRFFRTRERMARLRDKVALITGASSGIGRAAALRLARHGARVVLAARTETALGEVCDAIASEGGQALAVPTDVSDAAQCQRAVAAAVDQFGGLDILVCSAGLSLRGYFEGTALDVLERVMRVNFFGTLYATHFALPHVKARRGSLVAISSLTGKRGIPSYSLYGASKSAVQGLYESLRLELQPDGVHVGVLAPAYVDTPLRDHVLGPDGQPWPNQPAPPFRIWPVEKCVDRLIRLIVRRRAEELLPAFTGPLLNLDRVFGSWLGNTFLRYNYPPELEKK